MALDLADSIATCIGTAGLAVYGTSVFAHSMPLDPVICSCVLLTGGPHIAGDPTKNKTFQVLHRNTQIATGFEVALAIFALLDNSWGLASAYPGRIVGVTEPGAWFRDDRERPVFTLNFIHRSATAT